MWTAVFTYVLYTDDMWRKHRLCHQSCYTCEIWLQRSFVCLTVVWVW